MSDFAALECDLAEAPLFYVEPRDRDPASELHRQRAFRKLCRKELPGVRVVAIPNAGKRGLGALNQARAEGAAWGFPDVMVIAEGRVAFVEFKSGSKPPEQHQTDWLNWLHCRGFAVAVIRTAAGGVAWLKERGF